jgi:N-acyl-D-amino-acid deacylase
VLLITNGLVYDGGVGEPMAADVLVDGDTIAAVGPEITADAEVVDAAGRAVTPGFIDVHRHADLGVLWPEFGAIELAQGLTTINVGVCGLSPAPYTERSTGLFDLLTPTHGPAPDDRTYPTLADYVQHLHEVDLAVNTTTMQGLGAVKVAAKGYATTPYAPDELARAQDYVRAGLELGVPGFSTGLIYQPEASSTTEEMIAVLSPCQGQNQVYMPHMRNEFAEVVPAVRESIAIARATGMALGISHFKAMGEPNWGWAVEQSIELIEEAQADGLDVTVDFYPYHGGATSILSLLPPPFITGGVPQTIATILEPERQDRLRQIYDQANLGVDPATQWERCHIGSVTQAHNRRYVGHSIHAGAVAGGFPDEVAFLCHLIADEQGKAGVIGYMMDEADIRRIAQLPYSMVISDALYCVTDSPHPRLYGTFARIIQDYVLAEGVLTLPEAIHKMTRLPADRLGLTDRGRIEPGAKADLLVFDPAQVRDTSTYFDPNHLVTGMDRVYVNGQLAWADQAVQARKGVCLL